MRQATRDFAGSGFFLAQKIKPGAFATGLRLGCQSGLLGEDHRDSRAQFKGANFKRRDSSHRPKLTLLDGLRPGRAKRHSLPTRRAVTRAARFGTSSEGVNGCPVRSSM